MQLIGELFEASLRRSGRRLTIVGATSGDTGSAAIEAFRGREGVEVFILFPDGRVSEVQRRQMTTPAEANVHALAIAGDFDDAQARLKDLFNDHAFRDGVGLAGVNSINWARVLAQTVYYFTAAVALGAPHRPVSFTVPTGNFGDVFAGYVAQAHGAADRAAGDRHQPERHPAPDARDRRAPAGGRGAVDQPVDGHPGQLELRAAALRALRPRGRGGGGADGRAGGGRRLRAVAGRAGAAPGRVRQRARLGGGDAGGDRRDLARDRARSSARTPPSGIHAARVRRGDPAVPMVVLATAHPAKFPDAVEAACGVRPALPPRMADLMTRPERVTRVANDVEAIKDVIGRETVR